MIATVLACTPQSHGALLTVALPAGIDRRAAAGRFLMARACDGSPLDRGRRPTLRRALFVVRVEAHAPGSTEYAAWTLLIPPDSALGSAAGHDPGYTWLRRRAPGDRLDLLGPYGVGLEPPPSARALLLAADAARAPALFPLIETMLDRGGRVSLILVESESAPAVERAALPLALPLSLPLDVEARIEPAGALAGALANSARWADLIALALPASIALPPLLHALRTARFRLDAGVVYALADAPLPCGVGACLGCLTPLAGGGFTRACVHGPLFDLTRVG